MDHARQRPAGPTPTRPEHTPAPDRFGSILGLQRAVGNAALAHLLSVGGPQRQAEDTLTEPGTEPGTDLGNTSDAEALDEDAGAAVDPATKPMLRYGSRGPSVVEAQTLLNGHGALPALNPDGIFGPLTRAATIAFQDSHGLVPDGIIGPLTWGALLTPFTPPALFTLGDDGPDVGLLEQRLNAAGMAQPPLPIDATYDIAVLMAVVRFQLEVMGAVPTGSVDQATWDALEAAAPGGGLDAAGFEEHVASVDADAHGEQLAGTSLHQPVGPGGLLSGPAVQEYQQKLNSSRLAAGLDPLAEDATWGTALADATIAYQASKSIPETGVGDLLTWHHLDIDAPVTTVGFVDRQWVQDQGGQVTGMSGPLGDKGSKYSWRIAGNRIVCSAKVDFRNNPPSPDWFGFVTTAWSIYKAVSDTGDEVMIDFEMAQGTGADANVVDVQTGSGRANAGKWFLTDDDAANTIPHEYGHLIGLRDEYQVHPGDYREITGNEPPVGESGAPADGSTPEQVADEVQDAIAIRDSAALLAATTGRGIAIGAWAQRVVAAYALLPPVVVPAKPPPKPKPAFTTSQTDIAHDINDSVGIAGYEAIQVLTYTSGSLMGDPSRVTDPHDHGVQPRHVQEFCDRVAAARGGSWRVEPRS